MRIFILFILVSCIQFASNAQKTELRAYLDSKQFFAPGVGNYVEFHLQFVGHSINYLAENGGLALRFSPHGDEKDSLLIGAADFKAALNIIKTHFLKAGLNP